MLFPEVEENSTPVPKPAQKGFKFDKTGSASRLNTRYDSFENDLGVEDKANALILEPNETAISHHSSNISVTIDERFLNKFEENGFSLKQSEPSE